jgi:hypothetical protein
MVNVMIYSDLCCRVEIPHRGRTLLTERPIDYRGASAKSPFSSWVGICSLPKAWVAKSAPLPDFYIGAHASSLGIFIVTGDAARYRTYFPETKLIFP